MTKTVKIVLIAGGSIIGIFLAWYLISKLFPTVAGPGGVGGAGSIQENQPIVQSAINSVIAANNGHTTYWKYTTLAAAQQQVFSDAVNAWGVKGNVGSYSQYTYSGLQWGANGKGGTSSATSSSGSGILGDITALLPLAALA